MIAVQGYYDGIEIKPLEKIHVKKNQRIIITVMDEFVDTANSIPKKGIRGILSPYADNSLIDKEKGAWEHAMVEKHGDA